MKQSTTVLFIVASLMFVLPHSANAQSLTITFTTTEAGGNYAPRNVVAVWAEADDGSFVKTLGRWSDRRTQHLVAWNLASGGDADAVSGATRGDNADPLTVTWDFTDVNSAAVAEGVYTIRMELADRNSNAADENNQGTFTVDHNGTSAMQMGTNGGFDAVTLDYQAAMAGMPDAGGGSGGGDECTDDDGACPSACTADNDNDCVTESSDGDNLEGGCQTSTGGGGLLGALLLAGLIGMRRRRRPGA